MNTPKRIRRAAGSKAASNPAPEELRITYCKPRGTVAGTWASGTIGAYRFEALLFREHAEVPEYEIGQSYLSKLWVQRISDEVVVFNWDRGPDRAAADAQVQAAVDRLVAELAKRVFDAPGGDVAAAVALTGTDALFEQIAKEHLRIETLQLRGRDQLDFHDVSVSGVRRALAAAYAAGQQAAAAGAAAGGKRNTKRNK